MDDNHASYSRVVSREWRDADDPISLGETDWSPAPEQVSILSEECLVLHRFPVEFALHIPPTNSNKDAFILP